MLLARHLVQEPICGLPVSLTKQAVFFIKCGQDSWPYLMNNWNRNPGNVWWIKQLFWPVWLASYRLVTGHDDKPKTFVLLRFGQKPKTKAQHYIGQYWNSKFVSEYRTRIIENVLSRLQHGPNHRSPLSTGLPMLTWGPLAGMAKFPAAGNCNNTVPRVITPAASSILLIFIVLLLYVAQHMKMTMQNYLTHLIYRFTLCYAICCV